MGNPIYTPNKQYDYDPVEWTAGTTGGVSASYAHEIDPGLSEIITQLNYWVQGQGYDHIRITSGKRSREYNATLPGASPNSLHIGGYAVDIAIDRYDSTQLHRIETYLQETYGSQSCRILYEGDHLHITVPNPTEAVSSWPKAIPYISSPDQIATDVINATVPGYTSKLTLEVPFVTNIVSYNDLQDVDIGETSSKLYDNANKPGSFKFGAIFTTVPPISIHFTEQNNIVGIPTIRNKGSIYWRTGANSISIDLEFLFPGLISANDELRHIIAQVKRCPFLPLENYYLHTLLFPRLASDVPYPDIPYDLSSPDTDNTESKNDKQTGTQNKLRPTQWRLKNTKIEDIIKTGDEPGLLEYINKGSAMGFYENEDTTSRDDKVKKLTEFYDWMKTYRHIDITDSGLSYRDQQMVAAIRNLTISSVPGFPHTLQLNTTCDIFNYFPYSTIFAFIQDTGKERTPVFNISKSTLFKNYYQGLLTRGSSPEFLNSIRSDTSLEAFEPDANLGLVHLQYIYAKGMKSKLIARQQVLINVINEIKNNPYNPKLPATATLYEHLIEFFTTTSLALFVQVEGDIWNIIKEYAGKLIKIKDSIVSVLEFYYDSFGKYWLGKTSNNEIYVISSVNGLTTFTPLKEAIGNPTTLMRILNHISKQYINLQILNYDQKDIIIGDDKSTVVGFTATMETKLFPMQILSYTKPTFQHLGNSEWIVTLTIETSNLDLIRDLREMTDNLNYTAIVQKSMIVKDLYNLSASVVESPLLSFLGINNVVIGNFRYSTIEGKPGRYSIQLDMVQSDITVKSYEALQGPAYFQLDHLKELIKLLPQDLLLRINNTIRTAYSKGDYNTLQNYKTGLVPVDPAVQDKINWSIFLYHLCKPVSKHVSDREEPVFAFINLSSNILQSSVPPTPTDTSVIDGEISDSGYTKSYMVKRIIDGDTIVLDDGTTIRLLGIDAPESGTPNGEKCTTIVGNLCLGKSIKLKYGKDRHDIYGRTLAYVYVSGMNINQFLLDEGYATPYGSSNKAKLDTSFPYSDSSFASKENEKQANIIAGAAGVFPVNALYYGTEAIKFVDKTLYSAYTTAVWNQLKATLQNALMTEEPPGELKLDSTPEGQKILGRIIDAQRSIKMSKTCYPDLELPEGIDSPDFWFYHTNLFDDNIQQYLMELTSMHGQLVTDLAQVNLVNKTGHAMTPVGQLTTVAKQQTTGMELNNASNWELITQYLESASKDSELRKELTKSQIDNLNKILDSNSGLNRADKQTLLDTVEALKKNQKYYDAATGIFDLRDLNSGTGIASASLELAKMWGIVTPRSVEMETQMLKDAMNLEDNKTLRIGRAFPTFKFYFIEKDKEEWLFFDDFYGYGAVKDIQIRKTRKSPIHTAIVTLSNVSNVLQDVQAPKTENPTMSETAGEQPDIDTMMLREGCEIMIKMGYGNSPDDLKIVFQGCIISIQPGPELTIMAQGWGAELTNNIRNFDVKAFGTIKEYGDIATTILNSVPGLRHFGTTYNLAEMIDTSATVLFNDDYRKTFVNQLENWAMQGLGFGPIIDHRDDNIWLAYNAPPTLWPGVFEGQGIGFDWTVVNQTAWDALWDIQRYMPGYIIKILPYNEDNTQVARSTLYFGPRDGYYLASDRAAPIDAMKQSESEKYQMNRKIWYLQVKETIGGSRDDLIKNLKPLGIDYDSSDGDSKKVARAIVDKYIHCTDGQYSLVGLDPSHPYLFIYGNTNVSFGNIAMPALIDIEDFTKAALLTPVLPFIAPAIALKLGQNIFNPTGTYFERIKNPNTLSQSNFFDIYDFTHQTDWKSVYGEQGFFGPTFGRSRFTYGKDINPKELVGKTGYKRVCNYHLVDSYHHIIANNMKATSEAMYNKVRLLYPPGEPKVYSYEDIQQEKDIEVFELIADDNIKPELIRTHRIFFPNIDVNRAKNFVNNVWTIITTAASAIGVGKPQISIDIPPYVTVANSILAEDLQDMYDGDITILLDPNIDIYDVVFLYDDVNEIYGPVGVKEVYHYFSMEHGAYTVIVPDLLAFPSDMQKSIEFGYAGMLYKAIAKINAITWGGGLAAGLVSIPLGGGPVTAGGLFLLGATLGVTLSSYIGTGMLSKILGREGAFFIPAWRKSMPFLAGMDGFRKDDLLVHYLDKVYTLGDLIPTLKEQFKGIDQTIFQEATQAVY